MRSIWKGAISFGLVSIPVKLYSATQENDVSFHQVHVGDGGRIRYKRVCQVDGEEVPYSEIGKGYELPTGEVVVLTDDDLADLPLSTSRSIDVLTFVPLEQVDPLYFAKSYYLEPEAAGTKPYVLLRRALEESGRVAVVKIALRQRESLATLRVRDGVFVLEMMLWPDEIRTPDFGFLDEDVEVRQQELAMAASLIETLSGDFHPEEYTDGYREALQALIDAKVEGREVVAPADGGEQPGAVVDLMAALRASVEAAKAGRAGGAADDESVTAGEDAGAKRAGSRRRAAAAAADEGQPARRRTGSAAGSGGSSRGSAGKGGSRARKAADAEADKPGKSSAKRSSTRKSA